MPTRQRKEEYFTRMTELLDTYTRVLVVHCDHVGSQQMHAIRQSLRGSAEVLMGKNTLMRKVIKTFLDANPEHPIESLVPSLLGNVGLIFTNEDFGPIREVIAENRVPAAAKAGVLAEVDVIVPPGPTGCDPGQTSWFQALNVPTKISRGQIEIVSELKLVAKGEKVTQSQSALLQKLNIRPFTYGLVLREVYDNGKIFSAKVLDITSEDLEQKFAIGLRRFAAVSREIGVPTLPSLPHSFGTGIRRLIAVAGETGYCFAGMEEWDKLFKMDPEELAKLQASAGASGDAGAAEEKAEEKEEEEEVDMGGAGNLFGGDEDGY
eukprot:snap_masked-scaffold_3-processed-gene-1.6-mRNA-1 protein AED:0.14 eAED:0.14 QI:0/-1/0/1/-1/1/1/0/320